MTSAKMTWKKLTIIASLLTATALVCIPALGQSKTQPVLVVNSSGQPVPTAAQGTTNVAGTINVGNSPSVSVANTPNVNVANTPTVNLAAGGSVNVTNQPNGQNNPTPLAVLEATQPYEDSCQMFFSNTDVSGCLFQAIPSGKRLVIQEFDADAQLLSGFKPTALLCCSKVGQVMGHFFPVTYVASYQGGSTDVFITHQQTWLYVGGGRPSCNAVLSGPDDGNYICQFSGFLVDVP